MRRKFWIIGGIVAFLFLLLALVRAEIKSKLSLPAIESRLSTSLGMQVKAHDITLAWDWKVALNQVAISADGQPFLKCAAVEIGLNPGNLLFGKIAPASIILDHPSLALSAPLIDLLLKRFKQPSSGFPSFPLYLQDGEVSYVSSVTRKQISISHLNGSLLLSGSQVPLSLSFAEGRGGICAISGQVGRSGVDLKITFDNAGLSDLVNPFGKFSTSLAGSVSGNCVLKGALPNLSAAGDLNLTAPLLSGEAQIAGNLARKPAGLVFQGHLSIGKGNMEGGGEFQALSTDFEVSSGGASLRNGILSLPAGKVNFWGSVGASNKLSIGLKSTSFNPLAFANLQGGGLSGMPGSFSASASGVFPDLEIRATGEIPEIAIGAEKLKHITVQLAGRSTDQKILFDEIKGSAGGVPLSLLASLDWDHSGNLVFHFSQLNAGDVAHALGFPTTLAPARMILFGELTYSTSSKELKGSAGSNGGALAGIPFSSFYGTLSYSSGGTLDFSGAFQAFGKSPSFHAVWESGSGLQVGFTLPKGEYAGKNLPALSGTVRATGNEVSFSPISFPGITPPLSLTGSYNLKTKSVSFHGELNGQDPALFLPFFPTHLPAFSAALYGSLSVSGVYPELSTDFSGSVTNARFQDILVPSGKLTITGKLPASLSVKFHTDQFSLGSVELIHQFVAIDGTGSVDIASAGSFHAFSVSFTFPNTSLRGKPIGTLSGALLYRNGSIKVERILLPITRPPVVVMGQIGLAGHEMNLHARLSGERISNLASFLGKPGLSVDGELYGNALVKGSPSRISLNFSGKGENLSFSGIKIGSASLLAEASPSETGFDITLRADGISLGGFSALQEALPGLKGSVSLSVQKSGSGKPHIAFQVSGASLHGKPLPDLSGVATWASPMADFSQLSLSGMRPPLGASGWMNTQSHAFQISANLQGEPIGPMLGFLPMKATQLNARLFGPVKLSGGSNGITATFVGGASNVSWNGMRLGKGDLHLNAQDSPKAIRASIEGFNFPAALISPLNQRYPGISGTVSFDVEYGEPAPDEATLNLSLKNANWKGSPFPELDGNGLWVAPILQVASLGAPGINPPLSFSGRINATTKAILLSANLNGQSISDLMNLAGSSSKGMSGNLFGPLKMNGALDAPVVHFQGKVQNLKYRGVSFGSGNLSLVESKASISGKLTLDKLIYLGANQSAIGSLLSQLPYGIGGAYNQFAQNKAISGVVIAGTPQSPKIALVFQEVGR